MDEKIEKELKDMRRNLELEVERGTFPNIDLNGFIESLRRGIWEAENGLGIPYAKCLKEMEEKYLYR